MTTTKNTNYTKENAMLNDYPYENVAQYHQFLAANSHVKVA
jgi:hypothetical protein